MCTALTTAAAPVAFRSDAACSNQIFLAKALLQASLEQNHVLQISPQLLRAASFQEAQCIRRLGHSRRQRFADLQPDASAKRFAVVRTLRPCSCQEHLQLSMHYSKPGVEAPHVAVKLLARSQEPTQVQPGCPRIRLRDLQNAVLNDAAPREAWLLWHTCASIKFRSLIHVQTDMQ